MLKAFDNMSEESEKNKKNFFVKKLLRPVPSRGMVEQANKNMADSDPSEVTQDTPFDPRERGGRRYA